MKVKGQKKLSSNSKAVAFRRGKEVVTLIVSPLPCGWMSLVNSNGATGKLPKVPKKVMMNARGMPIVDADNNPRVEDDYDDPEYSEAVRLWNNRMTALRVHDVLRYDDNVEFESQRPQETSPQKWQTFADGVWRELQEFGLTDEEVGLITKTSEELSLDLDIDEAKSTFSQNQPQD